jgi:hypothetical protein
MRNVMGAIWSFYTGVLRLVGETILIFAGIALCGYTMMQQFEQLHSTGLDSALFAAGISLVAFRAIRSFVWTVIGVSVPWGFLVVTGVYLLINDFYRFRITPELIALGGIPPVIVAALLEFAPKSEAEVAAEAAEPHLEITIDEPAPEESVIDERNADSAELRD